MFLNSIECSCNKKCIKEAAHRRRGNFNNRTFTNEVLITEVTERKKAKVKTKQTEKRDGVGGKLSTRKRETNSNMGRSVSVLGLFNAGNT